MTHQQSDLLVDFALLQKHPLNDRDVLEPVDVQEGLASGQEVASSLTLFLYFHRTYIAASAVHAQVRLSLPLHLLFLFLLIHIIFFLLRLLTRFQHIGMLQDG